jgi:hypothetical protein
MTNVFHIVVFLFFTKQILKNVVEGSCEHVHELSGSIDKVQFFD